MEGRLRGKTSTIRKNRRNADKRWKPVVGDGIFPMSTQRLMTDMVNLPWTTEEMKERTENREQGLLHRAKYETEVKEAIPEVPPP